MRFLSNIAIIILLITAFFLFPYYHELGHQKIYRAEGTKSDISIDWKGWATTSTGCKTEECEVSQNFHEAIAYNLSPLLFIIMVFFIIIIIQNEERNKLLEEKLER